MTIIKEGQIWEKYGENWMSGNLGEYVVIVSVSPHHVVYRVAREDMGRHHLSSGWTPEDIERAFRLVIDV